MNKRNGAMTIQQMKKFKEGHALWSEYVRVNGYAFEPKKDGITKLARLLDLKQSYIQEHINFYLEA